MKKHILQWHITHKCNLRCLHCYQEDYTQDFTLSQIQNILGQYLDFLKAENLKGHINLTGGEPFVYPCLFDVLDLFEKYGLTFGLLSNGTLLDEKNALHLQSYKNLSFVQISLDGIKSTHEHIRSVGTFGKSLHALHLLKKHHITSMVSFTAQKSNYKELHDVIQIAKKNKADCFWTDRLIPIGNTEEILSTQDFLSYIQVLNHEAEKAQNNPFCHTTVRTNRALQFCGGSDQVYHCSAGNQLLTILANGDLVPCRRLPISLGNVLEKPLLELYLSSTLIQNLKRIPAECTSCYKAPLCRGGLRCLTYAVTHSLDKKDINCPYL